MPKAIFFDLDGTLTDSGPGIMNCAEPALAHFGIQVRHRDELRVFVGPPLRQSFARFGVREEGDPYTSEEANSMLLELRETNRTVLTAAGLL